MAADDEQILGPIGPGAIEVAQSEYIPALNDASQDEVVEILNPLTSDFHARVGVTRDAMMPVRIVPNVSGAKMSEAELESRAGLSGFRNPDLKGGRVHVSNVVVIPAGQTIRQPGPVAQTIVKQLITAIIQVRGQKLMIADPATRSAVEKEVIMSRRPIAELWGTGGPVSVQEQIDAKIAESNRETEEMAFPDVNAVEEPASGTSSKAKSKAN